MTAFKYSDGLIRKYIGISHRKATFLEWDNTKSTTLMMWSASTE